MQNGNSMYSGKDECELCIGNKIFTLLLVSSQVKRFRKFKEDKDKVERIK